MGTSGGKERTRSHFLETDCEGTLGLASENCVGSEAEGTGAGGAVIVDVDDGDTSHTELVENTLTAGGVTVDVTGSGVIDMVVSEASINEGLDGTFETEDGVVLVTRFGEGSHADTDNVSFTSRHFETVVRKRRMLRE